MPALAITRLDCERQCPALRSPFSQQQRAFQGSMGHIGNSPAGVSCWLKHLGRLPHAQQGHTSMSRTLRNMASAKHSRTCLWWSLLMALRRYSFSGIILPLLEICHAQIECYWKREGEIKFYLLFQNKTTSSPGSFPPLPLPWCWISPSSTVSSLTPWAPPAKGKEQQTHFWWPGAPQPLPTGMERIKHLSSYCTCLCKGESHLGVHQCL